MPLTAQFRQIVPPSTLYAAHVAHLGRAYASALAESGYDGLVIDGGAAAPKSRFDDQDWPFKPSPGFAHWLPLVEPDAWLVVEPGHRPRLLRRHQVSYWEGPTASVGEEVWSELDTATIAHDSLTRELPQGKRLAYLGEDAARASSAGVAEEDVNPPALVARLDAVRALKTDYERECISEANRRAVRGHKRVFGEFSIADKSELELHLLYLEATGQDDHEAPYKGIVALGRHAGVLHHVSYEREPTRRPLQSLLVDAGASVRGYASDITRTAIKGQRGGAGSVFADLIVRVETLQQDVIRRIKPDMPYEDLHDQAHVLLAPILRELDLVRASDDELVGGGVTRKFLPHGLGHSLGIQVHDVGCKVSPPRPENPFLRNTSPITAGQVFTIEPGCYFIPELMAELRQDPIQDRVNWPLVEQLSEFGGVRIEDNIAVMEQGVRNLTREAWRPE